MIRLARHDVRVHVRRRVVHIPVRQTTLRPVTAVATEQGKDAHRFPCHVKVVIFMSEILSQKISLVSAVPPFSKIVENLAPLNASEGKPSEPPFAGEYLPRSPSLLTQLQQAVYKKGSPRGSGPRATQGCPQTRTTNHTSTRYCGRHRTGQLSRPRR